jgi:tripartite-type tricarboxylate transporter receptor subunit TctC
MTPRLVHVFFALAFALAFGQSPAFAQYPDKSIRIIVPYPGGSSGDIIARVFGQRLSDNLKQPVVIDNRPGGSGVVATAAAAKSPPDGYTLLLNGPNHVTNVGLYPSLPYDPKTDFAEISLVGAVPVVMVANRTAGVRSTNDLVEKAKANPYQLNFASAGIGTGGHLAMELFIHLNGIKMTHVPYRGATPALTDVVAGHVQFLFTGIPPALEFIRSGALVPLLVSSPRRNKALPDTPTGQEIGLKDFDVDVWFGLMAPAGTPKPIIDLLAGQVKQIVSEPAVIATMDVQGIDPGGGGPQELRNLILKDLDRWPKLIKDAGIKIE